MDNFERITTIGVVGAGTMGRGIALTALYAGFDVVLQDPYPESLAQAAAYLLEFLERKGLGDRMASARLTGDLSDFAGCDVVVEAALEDLALKREIFRELDAVCGSTTLLATNTSTLSVTAIAAAVGEPARVAGMHFFNPAPVMPLVEVVRGARTSPHTIERLIELAQRLGKTPVEAGDTPGFIVNRVARPFYGEALRLLGEGAASHAAIDQALRMAAGFKLGPFQLMDLIGVDINTRAMVSLYEQSYGEPRYRPHWIQLQQAASGDLGRKTGRGFYDYHNEQSGVLDDAFPELTGGSGQILFYSGLWDCGIDRLLFDAGYRPEPFPDRPEEIVAVILTQTSDPDLAVELERLDWLLPESVPVFVQCVDATLLAQLPPSPLKGRFIGFDALFLAAGRAATLVAGPGLSPEMSDRAERFVRTLGRLPIWVADTPGLVAPRVVAMLVNEAAFAVQDGVASPDDVDRAMRLGVNYPKGLIEWGREIGWERVLAVLELLQAEYGEDRYRPSRLIRRWALEEARSAASRVEERRDPWDV